LQRDVLHGAADVLAFATELLGTELELCGPHLQAVSGKELDGHGARHADPVHTRAVGAGVDDERLVLLEVEADLEVMPGDGVVLQDQTVVLVDAGALAADEEAVGDGHDTFAAGARTEDHAGQHPPLHITPASLPRPPSAIPARLGCGPPSHRRPRAPRFWRPPFPSTRR